MATANEVARELLPWLASRTVDKLNGPTLAGFFAAHQQLPEQDVLRALDRLEHDGMVKVHSSFDPEASWEVVLQPAGFECVEEYDADLRAWSATRSGGGSGGGNTTIHNTITMGDHSQASAFTTGDVTQTITHVTGDPETLRQVSLAAREILPLLPDHAHDRVRQAALELHEAAGAQGAVAGQAAAGDEVNDKSKVRAAATKLVAALSPFASTFTIITFIIKALTGGLAG